MGNVNTKLNPADILSRGADLEALTCSNWFEDSDSMHTLLHASDVCNETVTCKLENVCSTKQIPADDNVEATLRVEPPPGIESATDSLGVDRVTCKENGASKDTLIKIESHL